MKSAKHKRKYYFFAWSGMLNLEFSGNTANCSVSVIAVEQEIKVSMSLWQRNRIVASWSEEGSGAIYMNKKCTIETGKAYTLKATIYVNNEIIVMQPVTRISNKNKTSVLC